MVLWVRGVGRGPKIPGSRLYRREGVQYSAKIFTNKFEHDAMAGAMTAMWERLDRRFQAADPSYNGSLASLHPASNTTLAKGLYIGVRISKPSGLNSLSPPKRVCYKYEESMYCEDTLICYI